MAQDGFAARERFSVVHEAVACAHPPERRGAHQVCSRLTAVLNNAVARSNVVQQKIAERMNDFVAQK